MTRFNEKTDTSAAAIRSFANKLRLLATKFEYQADSMDEHDLKSVGVTHWKSVRNTLDGLGKFAGAIQEAITDATLMEGFDQMVNNDELQALKLAAAESSSKTEKLKQTSKKKST